MAAVDYFLKLDGIKGESPDHKHKDEIQLLSFSWGVSQMGTSSVGGGAGAGRAALQDFSFTHTYDFASPNLFLWCASGTPIKEGVLVARKAGKDQQEYLTVTMKDIHVTNVTTSGGDGVPIETVTLQFREIAQEYKIQKEDGTLGAAAKTGWDQKANKKV